VSHTLAAAHVVTNVASLANISVLGRHLLAPPLASPCMHKLHPPVRTAKTSPNAGDARSSRRERHRIPSTSVSMDTAVTSRTTEQRSY